MSFISYIFVNNFVNMYINYYMFMYSRRGLNEDKIEIEFCVRSVCSFDYLCVRSVSVPDEDLRIESLA